MLIMVTGPGKSIRFIVSIAKPQNRKSCEQNVIASERNSNLLAQNTSVLEQNITRPQNSILWT